MYRNFQENCYCVEYHRKVHCCNYRPVVCYLLYCPCQLICYRPLRIFPRTYRNLSEMPPKLNSSSETSSTKKGAKLKKRNLKSKSSTKNSIQSQDFAVDKISLEETKASNSISSAEYSTHTFDIGNNVRLTHSENLVGSGSNGGINYSDSYCTYQCQCRPLEGCQDKQEMNFSLVTHNGVPIKQTHQDRRSSFLINRNSTKQNEFYYNNLEHLKSPTNSITPSYESRNSHLSEASINRRASYDSPNSYTSQIKPNISTKPNCNACINCQHSDTITNTCAPKSSENHSCKCNCNLCPRVSPSRSSSLRSIRQSFSSSKSCPQLDIIKEEEPGNEDHTNLTNNKDSLENRNSREYQTKSETRSKPTSSGPLKIQKSLEDSCADFLNIVCDNILETVQKSVDNKLKEYCSNVKENFESLERKLEKSESVVRGVCWEILEKMTEQNKNNFEQICSLVQNLVENRTANQYAMTRNNCQDKECQWVPLLRDEIENNMEILDVNADNGKNINNEDDIVEKNTESVVNSASFTKNVNILKMENTNNIKSKWCNCCHCNDTYLVPHVEPDKPYSNKTVAETIETPSYSTDENVPTSTKTHLDKRSTGGCTDCGKSKREDIKLVKVPRNQELISGRPIKESSPPRNSAYPRTTEQSLKFPALHRTSSSTSETLTSQNASGTDERDTSPPKYTTFCLTPSGKTIFNCNCSATAKSNVCDCKPTNDTNLELKPVCRNLYDNYDTSGYATEPEDNIVTTTGCNSARKKLQKKVWKQHCSSQTLEMGNTGGGNDLVNEKRGSHMSKKSGKINLSKAYNSSPTRLSRL